MRDIHMLFEVVVDVRTKDLMDYRVKHVPMNDEIHPSYYPCCGGLVKLK
jgi:hypothetical protein